MSDETAPPPVYLKFKYIEGGEEGEDDAKSACPSDALGYTYDTMAGTMGREAERQS